MGIMDKMKDSMANAKVRHNEHHVSLTITSGKKELGLGLLSSSVVIRQNNEGLIYFDTLPERFFTLTKLNWDGPKYKTVSISDTVGNSNSKTKHKGGLGGAIVGTMLMPGIGTAIGYAATRKKVQDTNSGSNTVKNEREEEIDSPASIVIHDVNSGENITFGFSCNTNIYNDLQNFDWDNSIPDQKTVEQDLSLQSDKVELMKKYKELLDAQVITQEEFDKKRKEILGF